MIGPMAEDSCRIIFLTGIKVRHIQYSIGWNDVKSNSLSECNSQRVGSTRPASEIGHRCSTPTLQLVSDSLHVVDCQRTHATLINISLF
jgi:hypothetical protein